MRLESQDTQALPPYFAGGKAVMCWPKVAGFQALVSRLLCYDIVSELAFGTFPSFPA